MEVKGTWKGFVKLVICVNFFFNSGSCFEVMLESIHVHRISTLKCSVSTTHCPVLLGGKKKVFVWLLQISVSLKWLQNWTKNRGKLTQILSLVISMTYRSELTRALPDDIQLQKYGSRQWLASLDHPHVYADSHAQGTLVSVWVYINKC